MSGTFIAILVIAAIVLLAGFTTWGALAHRRRNAKTLAGMSPEQLEVRDAQLEYDTEVKRATRSLALATKSYNRGVHSAQKAVSAAEKSGQRRIAACRGVDGTITLFEDRVTYNSRSFQLNSSFRASAETIGGLVVKRRATVARMAAGTLVLGPVGLIAGAAARKSTVHFAHELYLVVESDEFAASITCKLDDGAKVRQFAAQIVTAGKQALNVARSREQAIADARSGLQRALAATASRDAAQNALVGAKANTDSLKRAQFALDNAPRTLEL